MGSADLAHLRALLAEATPGPWVAIHHDRTIRSIANERGEDGRNPFAIARWAHREANAPVGHGEQIANADLIAAAVNAAPALLDEVERLRTLLDDDEHELGLLKSDVEEHLPEYVLDDGTDKPANYRERIEYAGQEIKRLQRENHRHQHGVQIEGDYVCAAELAAANGRARVEALERVAEAARAHHHLPIHANYSELLEALAALDGVTP